MLFNALQNKDCSDELPFCLDGSCYRDVFPGCLHDSDCPQHLQEVLEEGRRRTYYRCKDGVCLSDRNNPIVPCRCICVYYR